MPRAASRHKPWPDSSAPQPIELDCADDCVTQEMTRWLSHLRAERRLSPKTLEAYARDLRQCLVFLSEHWGDAGDAEAVCRARSHRRPRLHGDAPRRRHRRPLADAGAGGPALVRTFSRTRRQGQGRRAVRDPRAQGRQEPAEADPDGRGQALCRRRQARRRKPRTLDLGARRRRDGAALRLGPAHLRSAGPEAPRRADARRRRRARRHRQGQQDPHGAGAAERAAADRDYVAMCPHPLPPDGPIFVGARGGPLSPRIIQLTMERLRGALGLPDSATPHALRHSFATHLLTAAAICARSRNCSATRRCRPRRSTPASTASGCWKSTDRSPARADSALFMR